jgi:hypothetical protein
MRFPPVAGAGTEGALGLIEGKQAGNYISLPSRAIADSDKGNHSTKLETCAKMLAEFSKRRNYFWPMAVGRDRAVPAPAIAIAIGSQTASTGAPHWTNRIPAKAPARPTRERYQAGARLGYGKQLQGVISLLIASNRTEKRGV